MDVHELVALGRKAAVAFDRDDLADRLDAVVARLDRTQSVVLVVGAFKAGKSSLVNALVGADVCPVDDDLATVSPTVLSYADELQAVAHVRADDGSDVDEAVPFEDLAAWVTERGNPSNGRGVTRFEVGLPAAALQGGVVLVDTPGAGGLGSPSSAVILSSVPVADAVLFVSPATQELMTAEVDYLRLVTAQCRRVLVVEAKTDMLPHWQEIVSADVSHLAEVALPVPVVGTSATCARLAVQTGSAALDAESGLPAVLDWLGQELGAQRREVEAVAAEEVIDTSEQLRERLVAERAALQDPEGAAELIADLEAAVAEADAARGAAGRIGTVLNDAFGDASAEIDIDLKQRSHALVTEADAAVEAHDPARGWPALERWLRSRAASEVAAHAARRHDLLLDAITRVVEVVDSDPVPATLSIAPAGAVGASVPETAALDRPSEVKRQGPVGQGLTLLRGSYGGFAMLSFLGNFTGIGLAAPAVAGFGLLLGGRGLKEERDRQLAGRRAQAKVAVHKYLDEVVQAAGTESRNLLRQVQRTARDYVVARADERQRSASETLASARRAAETGTQDRAARLGDLLAEIERVDLLLSHAQAVAGRG